MYFIRTSVISSLFLASVTNGVLACVMFLFMKYAFTIKVRFLAPFVVLNQSDMRLCRSMGTQPGSVVFKTR